MGSEQITVNQVIVGLLENVGRQIKRATDEVTNEQLYYRPSADANSIAWLAWHLSRWQDYMSASISGDAASVDRRGLGPAVCSVP